MKLSVTLVLIVFYVHLARSSFIVTATNDDYVHIIASDFEKKFFQSYQTYINVGSMSRELEDMIRTLTDENIKMIIDDIPKSTNPQECLRCRSMAHTIIQFNKTFSDIDYLNALANNLCRHVTTIPEIVCVGMIGINSPVIKYILNNRPNIQAETICGITLQFDNCGVHEDLPDMTINDFQLVQSNVNQREKSGENLTIVHITDVHYDPYYNPGGNAVCGQGACCRLNQGEPGNASSAAGKWGDYRDCDSPWEAIVDIVEHIKSQYHKIDYIYFTGDIVDHFSWETTKQGNIDAMRKFFILLKDEFPDIPIFPVLGNHEAHPCNGYAPFEITDPNLSNQWLFDFVAIEWESWLPADSLKTIRHGGYYTTLVKPGFRIVALNSNVCYGHNWWLLYNSTFFFDQLHWLDGVLLSAGLDNEFVHIIGHVPSNDELCYKGWTKEYRKIIEKYGYFVTAQFNGHSHYDEFNVYYSKENSSLPVNVAWNGASGTPFTYLNPNYRVYYVDTHTHEVLDFDTWIYNLTEANLNPTQRPRWFKEYSFLDAYQITDLSLTSLDGLLKRFAANQTLLNQYWEYKVKRADPQLKTGCDKTCLLKNLCDIVRIEFGDTTKCDELTNIFWSVNQD